MTKVTNIEKHIIKRVNVGNVTQVTSANPWLPSLSFSETFTYDASDQLFPLLFLCSPKEKKQKEKAFAAGKKNPVHYARQLAERRNPLRSHRSTPLPCYGKRIFSVTPQIGEMTYSNREIQRIQLWQDATVSSEVPPCNLLFSFLCFVSFIFSGRRKKERNEGKNFYYHTNHLGSTAFVTDQSQNITQGFLYAPFGEITTEYNATFGNDIIPKYSFNAKELDEETGMYYYEARYYKPPVFTSRDPMFEKYFWMTPYAYCANNPVKYVDPSGREGITVSGSPGNHKNKRHFLENGLDRAKQAKTHFQRKGEVSTWIIYNDKINGYSSALINEYKKKAEKAGINVKVVSEVKEITDYVNNKNGKNTREKDKITSFYYLGHATPGDLNVGHDGTEEEFDPSDLNADAFSSGTFVDVVGGCRTAIKKGLGLFDPSIIKQFSKILDKKSEIRGSDVRVHYNGGVMTDEQLVKENKGNIVKINGRLD